MQKYVVTLTEDAREELTQLLSRGKAAARQLAHARILRKADNSPGSTAWDDAEISRGVSVGTATV